MATQCATCPGSLKLKRTSRTATGTVRTQGQCAPDRPNARIPVRAADWDWGEKRSLVDEDAFVYGARCYSHLKVMTVNGAFRGAPARTVFTGSENWSPPGLSSDEITLEIRNAAVLKAYNDRWWRMWGSRNATHRTGIEPTRRPCA